MLLSQEVCMKSDDAIQCFTDGFNCAQAVLSSFSDEYSCPKEIALKISGAFGSGMGQLGETCGAVTGALMVIGLQYGKFRITDTESKDRTYACVKNYSDNFKSKFGSIKCNDLIKYNLSNPNELSEARKAGVFKSICPELIKGSVEILESLIKRNV